MQGPHQQLPSSTAMTKIIVSAKSGSDWTVNELNAFKINIISQDSAEFFGVSPLPDPNVSPAIPTTPTAAAALAANDQATHKFLFLMGKAWSEHESWVDAFAVELFCLMRYEVLGRVAVQNVNLTFTMCGKQCHAQTDVCVMESDSILLVFQEDKRELLVEQLPEAQLMAEAIAAFDSNNALRRVTGRYPVPHQVMPGIIMKGTLPVFYKFNISQDLVDCVKFGQHPTAVTNIFRYLPTYPDDQSLGMLSLGNRRAALECYEAFRAFVIPPPLPQ